MQFDGEPIHICATFLFSLFFDYEGNNVKKMFNCRVYILFLTKMVNKIADKDICHQI